MGKVALVALVGQEDKGVKLPEGAYIEHANLPFRHHENRYDVSMHGFIRHLKINKLEPSELAMDLLVIACTMFGADTLVKRKRYSEDGWTRIIDLYIPVSDVAKWNGQKDNLQNIFKFLTGDVWTIHFRDRSGIGFLLSPKGRLQRYGMGYTTDTVCLFSGGMDSFIGAIDLLENGTRPLLVGHYKSRDVSEFQGSCGKALEVAYPNLKPVQVSTHISIPKIYALDKPLFIEGEGENTERGRSFLFLTLGGICASSLGTTSKLIVPENGMISLNIPLTPLRVGSHSTRTTHPFYFDLMQNLFDALGFGVKIKNPYQFKTKGEMLIDCKNKTLVVNTETMSCSHPSGRYDGVGKNSHCGRCVPCIIRRAAFNASGEQDIFPYRDDIFDAKGLDASKADGADVLAFKYMIAKVKKNPKFLTAAIRTTGALGENVDGYIDVYKRSLQEVDKLITPVKLK
ncbi:Qat anti-phage system QueC-like protein QatC [Daejeonella sp.]|uniref:Qat anti-phage system QueC-like protein QatC n=1 Tax=Daejeonella sp. TaxID=2805397 RepID=UPI0030BC3502